MRTTLDIDDDVLAVVKDIAAARKISAGKAISELARKALTGPRATGVSDQEQQEYVLDGIPVFRSHGRSVTYEEIERLLDEDY